PSRRTSVPCTTLFRSGTAARSRAYSENHKGRGLRVSSSVVADEADGEDGSAADARYAERCAVALRAPPGPLSPDGTRIAPGSATDRKSTRLNSSHVKI